MRKIIGSLAELYTNSIKVVSVAFNFAAATAGNLETEAPKYVSQKMSMHE